MSIDPGHVDSFIMVDTHNTYNTSMPCLCFPRLGIYQMLFDGV